MSTGGETKTLSFSEGVSTGAPSQATTPQGYHQPGLLHNVGLGISFAGGAMTIALKQSDGSTDPTTSGPVYVGTTAIDPTDGSVGYQTLTVSAALSLEVPSGAELGLVASTKTRLYVYLIDSDAAGTAKLAIMNGLLAEDVLQTSVAIGAGADSANVLYSNDAYSGKPIALLGYFDITEGTPGTWAATPSLIRIGKVDGQLIQDFTVVGEVGDTDQQWAGYDYSLADLNANLSTANSVLAYYRFADDSGNADVTDETGNYDLTNNNTVTNTTGIMDTNYAANFVVANSEYFSEGTTLLDSISGLSNGGIVIAFWMKVADGQIATEQFLFEKVNDPGDGYILAKIETDGELNFLTEQNAAGAVDSKFYTFADGAGDWQHMAFCWDTTHGKRLFVNGVLVGRNPDETTLMEDMDGGSSFMIGARNTPDLYYGGDMAHFMVLDLTATQRDIDYLYSVPVTLPASLQNQQEFDISCYHQELGDANYVQHVNRAIVRRDATRVFFKGNNIEWDASDKLKLIGKL